MGFPGGSDCKESAYNAEDLGLTLCGEDPLEKGMATHSSFLAWRSQWTEELDGLKSPWRRRVGHDWVTNTIHCVCIYILFQILFQAIEYRSLCCYSRSLLSVCFGVQQCVCVNPSLLVRLSSHPSPHYLHWPLLVTVSLLSVSVDLFLLYK